MAGLGLGETAEVPPGMAGRSRSKKAASRRGRWGRRFWLLLSLLTKVTRPSGAEPKLRLTGAKEPVAQPPPPRPSPASQGRETSKSTPPPNPLPQGEGEQKPALVSAFCPSGRREMQCRRHR